MKTIASLEYKGNMIRMLIVEMGKEGKRIHYGGSFSICEILAVLYFSYLSHNPANPKWELRDRFMLSKGHAAPALYAVLALSGYFSKESLSSYSEIGSFLQGHPSSTKTPGVELTSGSLGVGLSVAVGEALAAKMDRKAYRVVCLIGDGEMNEGQIWEAAMVASFLKLDNLCCIIDRNGLQYTEATTLVLDTEPVIDKWMAFGWAVQEIDGHDVSALRQALDWVDANRGTGRPSLILANTVKGKGVSFMENNHVWHSNTLVGEERIKALEEIVAKTGGLQ